MIGHHIFFGSLSVIKLSIFLLTFTDKSVAVQLRGQSSRYGTGRVEVFYNATWGTVCDDSWDINDAKVVCRELGYKNATKALQWYSVPDGSGQIWLDNVDCTGNEESLSTCPHRGWGVHNCWHFEDAGVECPSTGNAFIQ